jgi:hypothetical protein
MLRYAGGLLSLTLTDAVAGVSFTTNYGVNLPSMVGAKTAYVGFSGSTGGLTSQQQISNFAFISIPTLSIRLTSSNVALFSWPVAEAGFMLQRNSDLTTTNWVAVTAPINVVNGQNQVAISPPTGNQFYRLALPW